MLNEKHNFQHIIVLSNLNALILLEYEFALMGRVPVAWKLFFFFFLEGSGLEVC